MAGSSRWRLCVLPFIVTMVLACGDSPSEPSYENIAGTYAGVVAGISQGIALAGTFSITVQQAGGDVSGSYSMVGTLDDGVIQVDIQGTGTLSGTIGTGTNPSVNITLRTGFCPNYSAGFSGTYDSANRRITLFGPVDVLDQCQVFLRYQSTVVLQR